MTPPDQWWVAIQSRDGSAALFTAASRMDALAMAVAADELGGTAILGRFRVAEGDHQPPAPHPRD